MSAKTTSAMCTLHAGGGVKVFRTLHERPATRFARKPRRKNVLQLFVLRAPMNFLLNGWEHFSAGLLPSMLLAGGAQREFRHDPASATPDCRERQSVSASAVPFRPRFSPHPCIPVCGEIFFGFWNVCGYYFLLLSTKL